MPLPEGGSCLLGSINLASFVHNKMFDFGQLLLTVNNAVISLNNILDEGLPLHPLKYQQECVRDWRQIGLGTFGLADMLIKLGIKYGSKESLDIIAQVYEAIARKAILTSLALAEKYGAYPKCNNEAVVNSAFYKQFNFDQSVTDRILKSGLRNSQLLTCAPTGTTATMLGISTGLEPIFAIKYQRTTKSLENKDVVYDVYTPIAKEYLDKNENKELPYYFVDSSTITPYERILVQSTIQRYVDGSLSSTCNLKESTSKEEVYDLYMHAWKTGCKGVTVFRTGCQRAPILTTNPISNPINDLKLNSIQPVSRNLFGTLLGSTSIKNSACGKLYVTVNHDKNGNPVELFTNTSKLGICSAQINALTRMISLSLRAGVKVDEITDLLSCIRCPACLKSHKKLDGISCPDILAKALKEAISITRPESIIEIENKTVSEDNKENVDLCPECGRPLIHQGGCMNCVCGYSRCS